MWDTIRVSRGHLDAKYCVTVTDNIHIPVKCPAPLRNRDFVNQRSWRMFSEDQYVVFNHSVSVQVNTAVVPALRCDSNAVVVQ